MPSEVILSRRRRLNSRCTGQRPPPVQRMVPLIATAYSPRLSTPFSAKSARIMSANAASRRRSAPIPVSRPQIRSVSSEKAMLMPIEATA